ncbi:hypothetical protein [Halalkalibacter flavus]|uniref:hypothetical protein n=1 Tax=Halalkalibacter flavus TaxID=3090668 RepID=UPI002FCB00A9
MSCRKHSYPLWEITNGNIFDTPPFLSEQNVMPLSTYSEAGSYTVVMFDGAM